MEIHIPGPVRVERVLPLAAESDGVGEDESGVAGQLGLLYDGADPVFGRSACPKINNP